MVSITNSFMQHIDSVVGVDDKPTLFSFVNDDNVGISNIVLDQNGREDDDIVFTSIIAEIIVDDGVNPFTLDSISQSLTDLKKVNDIPFVDITEDRGFKTPADDLRRDYRLFSNVTIDAGGFFNYQVRYPWIHRWESWEPLGGVDDQFFDTTKQNNGENHNWVRYPTFPGANIYFKVTVNATKNGNPQQYKEQSIIQNADYTEGVNWNLENITTHDKDTDVSLTGGWQGYKNSLIKGNATFIGPVVPTIPDLVVVMRVNVFENGNFLEQYTLSNLYLRHPDSWLLSIDGSDLVVITNPSGAIFREECLLDGSKPPPGVELRFSARKYDLRPDTPFPFGDEKLEEDGTDKLVEAGGFKIID